MYRILLFILGSILSLHFQTKAQGDLMVTPIRVVFEGKNQKELLNLANMGKDTATYSISFINYNMKEDGGFIKIDKPDSGQMFAEPYLRIFPRKVTLAPGEPQAIMLQCRRSAAMLAGEYRSHLYFRAERNTKPLGVKTANDSTQLSVQLVPIFGISIPIIIRSGIVNVSSTLSDLKLDIQQGIEQNLKLTINRTGNISIYGDIIIEFFPTQGKPFEIAALKGVGVYTNINKRNLVIKLNNATGKPLSNGKIKVKYISNGEAKRIVYAEGELEISEK